MYAPIAAAILRQANDKLPGPRWQTLRWHLLTRPALAPRAQRGRQGSPAWCAGSWPPSCAERPNGSHQAAALSGTSPARSSPPGSPADVSCR